MVVGTDLERNPRALDTTKPTMHFSVKAEDGTEFAASEDQLQSFVIGNANGSPVSSSMEASLWVYWLEPSLLPTSLKDNHLHLRLLAHSSVVLSETPGLYRWINTLCPLI